MIRSAARRGFTPLSNLQRSLKSSRRFFSSFPDHTVVGMPSLSPTMTSGTITQWNFSPGDSFIAGDSLAEVQTDKASIDFESTDDGVMGLQFVKEGVEVQCGEPICITLEEGEEFNAGDFEGYVPEGGDQDPLAEEEPLVKAAASPPSPVPVPPSPPPAPTTPALAASVSLAPTSAPSPLPQEQNEQQQTIPNWSVINSRSPLYAKMAEHQQGYIEKYGNTGFDPM